MGDIDLGLSAMLVTLVAAVDIGPLDGNAGQALDLLDAPRESRDSSLLAAGWLRLGALGEAIPAADRAAMLRDPSVFWLPYFFSSPGACLTRTRAMSASNSSATTMGILVRTPCPISWR